MPEFGYEPRTTNDKSALSEGWKPAYLIAITDEATPPGWKMAQQSPRMWRWHFAVWEVPTLIDRQAPEHQSAPTSQKFSPGGQFQASKAYVWTCELAGRKIMPGERINLDTMMPIPCRVKIHRNNEYANIVDLEKWPEGQQYLTDTIKTGLANLMHQQPQNGNTQPAPPTQPVQSPPPPQQNMTTWGGGQAQPQPATAGGWGR